MARYDITGVRSSDGVECKVILDAESEAEALTKSKDRGIFPTKMRELPVLEERVPSRAFHPIEDKKAAPHQQQVRPMQIYGGLLLSAGLLCIAAFGLLYDTTVTTRSGGYFGVPSRTQTVHNIGKQQNRMLGFVGGIAAAGIGIVLLALDANQNTTKKDV